MTGKDLKRLERSTFRSAADSGMWDMFLAGIVSMLAIAPPLSVHLGDFWSSAVFVPVWVAALVVIRMVQGKVIQPRLGVVQFAPSRQKRLRSLVWIMLVVNVAALVLGVVAATRETPAQAELIPFFLSFTLLLGFSLVAFFLEIPRVFGYGLLLAAAPIIGESLWQRGYVTHHGFPVVFGGCAVIILVSGIVRFVRFLPAPGGEFESPSVEGDHE